MVRSRWWAGVAVIGAIAFFALRVERPHADLRILTHRVGDTAPQQVQAAIDVGIVAVSVIVTWSRELAR